MCKVEYRSVVSRNSETFCENAERYPTLLLKMFHLAPSPSPLKLIDMLNHLLLFSPLKLYNIEEASQAWAGEGSLQS